MMMNEGCIAFGLIYSLSALSTRAASLPLLLLGRLLGGQKNTVAVRSLTSFAGTATSLLFSAPEAWLVGEHGKQVREGGRERGGARRRGRGEEDVYSFAGFGWFSPGRDI
eukprot:666460-Hanusia_phi.AAC.4